MAHEDIVSLTKMKDGLTAPSQVEELVSLMQKEKDCVVKNVGDATRQWAAVASIITATENRDYLDLFIQLDGLFFIDIWLKGVQNFGNDTNESFVEDSVTAMLQALQKLQIDSERSISSGISITVESLFGHSSSRVQDRARALFDSWKQDRVSDAVGHDVESAGPCHNDGITVSSMHAGENSKSRCSALDVPLPKASADEERHVAEISPASLDGIQPERAEDEQIQTHNIEALTHINADMGVKPSDCTGSTVVSNSIVEKSFTKEKSPISTVEGTSSIETCTSPVPKQTRDEEQSDALNEFSKGEKQVQTISSFPDKFGVTACASSTVEPRTVSSGADVASAHEIVTEPTPETNFDANGGNLQIKAAALGDVGTPVSVPNNGMDDMAVANNCTTPVFKTKNEDEECHSDAMQESSGNECLYGEHKDFDTSSRIKDIGVADEDKDHTSDEGSDSRNDSEFSNLRIDTRSPDMNNNRTSDILLEYGIVDALEVARKVAQEVEREVVDYMDQSSSSSDKISEGEVRQPGSPESISGEEVSLNEVPPMEVSTGHKYSAEAYPDGEGRLINSDNVETEPGNGIVDMESSQVTEAAQEPEVNQEKGLCDFDLNEEVCSDDMDCPVNPVSTHVSVVSASRPAAAPGFPAAPLQFEGALGWKGSAATSAFRPASPRRVSDCDKTTLTVGVASSSSKQRQDYLDFDLNVTEYGDDDLMPEKQVPVASGLHSAESSLEVSPRRSERLKLDLNRISDDSDAPPSDFKMEGRLHYNNRNGRRSPSPASSSSSMQQPVLRNIDLNDRPYLHNDFADQGAYHVKSSQSPSVFGMHKPDDPVISIMGARVEVNKRDFFPQVSPFTNGKALEMGMDANIARSGGVMGFGPTMSYSHSPVFGYNGLATGPAMSYPSAMYGHGGSIPYMMDSRGAPVMPQIVGSSVGIPPSYTQQPFIMSMNGTPSGINGAGPSRPNNFDLNSGFPIEGGNRDSLGLRQLFMPGPVRSIEEQLRVSVQPSSSSGIGGKRKEPDGGWESYPFNYRQQQQQQPPWK